ncbi:MAG: hypothetical protein DCF25_16225 [Leptolyngbya foveolarum]|uniref:GmrSD restriction endonucleases N-terminal domain-containing protein n=1 Tax=Leptolyngbya foveolarum TaxID=47253 RepID=A0A2W4TWC8_9CYAN|nr:MAG: hypothetical protein DCF25_16225 [Leptolyngbya foveolarum]
MRLTTILDQIDMGSIALPEFQRGYVWNRDQVRNLMTSLYRGHPVGSLLVWETKTDEITDHVKGDGKLSAGTVKLLLDGQQRITSLYGIIRGKAPQFFDGNAQAFTGLYFNLEEEIFTFYMPTRMDGNPVWVSVTELMQKGAGHFFPILVANPEFAPKLADYANRLNAIDNIKNREFHIEEVSGAEKTVDEVVEIFNNVNSGGTKLSKGDLALARICAAWPEARDELKARLDKWAKAGFYFKLDWLLRCITAVTTNEALFSALENVSTERFRKGLYATEKAIDTLLNVISSRLGLDHDRVLGSIYAFPLMARYLDQRGGHFANHQERDQLLYWYVHTLLWGRYSGQTESTLRKDLTAIDGQDGSLDRLIELLRQDRGDLKIFPNDFGGGSKGNRFYPMLYLLTRVCKARDWEDDIPLSQNLLGKNSSLEVHHIFPKSKLYQHGCQRAKVNAIANFTFLTKETNLIVSNRDPEEYFAHYENKHPGTSDHNGIKSPSTIASHWIPVEGEKEDKNLRKYENYEEFLAARRELLAQAANDFLNSLHTGAIPEPETTPDVLTREVVIIPGGTTNDVEEQALQACNQWIVEQQLPAGELAYNLTKAESDGVVAILDLAWPDGLQHGYSQPVALLLDEESEMGAIANQSGFRFFTDIDHFKTYVRQEILAIDESVEEAERPADCLTIESIANKPLVAV